MPVSTPANGVLLGYAVAITHHDDGISAGLHRAGAVIRASPNPYRLLESLVRRQVHAVVFHTTAAQELIDVALRLGRCDDLVLALAYDVVAAGIEPELARIWHQDLASFVPSPIGGSRDDLTAELTVALLRQERTFCAEGLVFRVRGNLFEVGRTRRMLPPLSAAVLRAFLDYPATTLSATSLARLAPIPRTARGPSVEVAVRRLRSELGEHGWIVKTMYRRGYRLTTSRDPG